MVFMVYCIVVCRKGETLSGDIKIIYYVGKG